MRLHITIWYGLRLVVQITILINIFINSYTYIPYSLVYTPRSNCSCNIASIIMYYKQRIKFS